MVQQMIDIEDPAQKRATRKLLIASIACITLAIVSAAIAFAVVLQENRDNRIPHKNYVEKKSQERSDLKTVNEDSLILVPNVVTGHSLHSSSYMFEMTGSTLVSSPRSEEISSSEAWPSSSYTEDTWNPFSSASTSDFKAEVYYTYSSSPSLGIPYLSTAVSKISSPFTDILYGSTDSISSEEIRTIVLSMKEIDKELTSAHLQPVSTSVDDMINSQTIYSDIMPTMTTDPYFMTEIFTNFSIDSSRNIFLYSNFTTYQHVDTSISYSPLNKESMTNLKKDQSTSFMSPSISDKSYISVSHSVVRIQKSTESRLAVGTLLNSDITETYISSKEPLVSISSTTVKSMNSFINLSVQTSEHGMSSSFLVSKPIVTNTEFSSSSLVPFATSFKGSKYSSNSLPDNQWQSSVLTDRMDNVYITVSPTIFPDCNIGQFRCNSGQCVDFSRRCDRVIHCEDMSDEVNCSNCQGFQCSTGLCLWSWSVRCNERVECIDLSDEVSCDHGPSYRWCDNGIAIPSHQWCDNVDQCFDNSDEINCTCSYKEISCKDGGCIREEWICDGHVDCLGSTDENNCDQCGPDQYVCGDYSCINTTQLCDGIHDCPGAEDESKCYDVNHGKAMIVLYKGDNYTVCSIHWHSGISDYICQLLGYRNSSETNYTYTDDEFDKMELNQSVTEYKNILLTMNIRSSCTSNLTVSVSCMPRDCGIQSPDLMLPFVSGGDLASTGQWPWVVSLSYLGRPFCSGSLVSSDWIVTAGHCVAVQGSFNYTETPQYVEVVLGTNQRLRNKGTFIHSDRIVHHPDLRMSGIGPIYHDIALIHLSKPITFTDHIAPVCLPKCDFSALSNCHIAGWGYIGLNQDVTVQDLRSAKLHVLSDVDCQSNTVHMEDKVNTNITYCTLYKFGTISGCQGDSGSPLMCQDNTGHWVLAGVMSSGTSQCGVFSNTANRFTRVSAMLDWIYSTIQV